jgi:hypothetical protein
MRNGAATVMTAMLLGSLVTIEVGAQGAARVRTELVLPGGAESAETRRVLAAAVAMLPKGPPRIAVMDVSGARSEVRAHLLTLDAFVYKDNPWIYVVQQSDLLRRARTGCKVCIAMLATVLWHEMAHQDGADERGARQAEEELWTRFVRDGLTDSLTGLRYLQALKHRPDDQVSML